MTVRRRLVAVRHSSSLSFIATLLPPEAVWQTTHKGKAAVASPSSIAMTMMHREGKTFGCVRQREQRWLDLAFPGSLISRRGKSREGV